jgi:hypothetical protein
MSLSVTNPCLVASATARARIDSSFLMTNCLWTHSLTNSLRVLPSFSANRSNSFNNFFPKFIFANYLMWDMCH